MAEGRLSEGEMVEILEDLARNSNSATARIQAIKVLKAMADEEPVYDDDDLYADEFAARRGQG